jgi:predicted ATPase
MNERHQNFQITDLDPNILSTPFKIQTSWHVITGEPCCGKTTLINQLAEKGIHTVPEVGRDYIEREIVKGRTLGEIRTDRIAFACLIKNLQLEIECRLEPAELIFLDRGFPDSLAFFRLVGLDPNEILPECFHNRYASVFILDRFPTQKDCARIEDNLTAEFLGKWHAQDYSSLGYDVVIVPILPPEERLAFVLERLSKRDLPGAVVSPLARQER